MKKNLITSIVNEPISLSEVKNHLRISSNSFVDNITTYQTIVPFDHAIGTTIGNGIDVLAKNAIVNINSGTNGVNGTVNIKIQESDDDSTYTDWYSFSQITEANDNQIFEKEYTGTKQYIRCVATVATAACYFSCDVIVENGLSDENTTLNSYIKSAREYGEDITRQAFSTQTWDMILNDFPKCDDKIKWFLYPLQSITHVKYKDENGNQTTMTVNTDYIVDSNPDGGIFLPYAESWPDFIPYPYNAVEIRGICGFNGSDPRVIPYNFKQAMLLHCGYMYKFRDTEIPKSHLRTIDDLYWLRRKDVF